MPVHSAGILLYRIVRKTTEVFIVHPGGPFWKNRDADAWSIPKGEAEEGEDLFARAKTEFHEETGFVADGDYVPLKPLKQPSGKIVHIWAGPGNVDASRVTSNTFKLEWPPKSGKFQDPPEVDRGGWFDLATARTKLVKGQKPFIDQLAEYLKTHG